MKPEDNNGNTLSETTGAAVTTYAWDKDNRLRSVTSPTSGISTFEYDANGIRTKKVEGGVETRYLLDGVSVLGELDSSGATRTTFLNNPQAIDDVLAMNIGGQVVYPLADALGSLYALTDASGAVVRRQDFEVYGKRTSSTGTGPATDRGFAFRGLDAWGGYDQRARYYLPGGGRWLTADPVGMVDGPNQYLYVKAQPTRLVDPYGLAALADDERRAVEVAIAKIMCVPGHRGDATRLKVMLDNDLIQTWQPWDGVPISEEAAAVTDRRPFHAQAIYIREFSEPNHGLDGTLIHELRHFQDSVFTPDLDIPGSVSVPMTWTDFISSFFNRAYFVEEYYAESKRQARMSASCDEGCRAALNAMIPPVVRNGR